MTNLSKPTGQSQSSFDRSLLPPARIFYARELGKLTRPSRGWARGRCPWHSSKSGLSLSVNLDDGHFKCHGCGVSGGDIIDFVMMRDKVGFWTAADSLGCVIDATPDQRRAFDAARAQREREAAAAAEVKAAKHRKAIELREQIYTCVEIEHLAAEWRRELDRQYCVMCGLEYLE